MEEIFIPDSSLTVLQGQVVVVLGCSSGIGLAAVQLLLSLGAKVFGADLTEKPSIGNADFGFLKVDVTDWAQLRDVFKSVDLKHGHINHVFANAGIGPRTNLLEDELDENGNLQPPNLRCFNVNFFGMINMAKLGIFHTKKNPKGGSVVMTASASAFMPFKAVDYSSAKHGVLGLLRALSLEIGPSTKTPVRINAIGPSWTATGLVPEDQMKRAGLKYQSAEAAARSALILMADESRHGQFMYSAEGKYCEIEQRMRADAMQMLADAPRETVTTGNENDDHEKMTQLGS